ncbi:MAG: hypothetical protein F4Z36_09315 [Acidimicrobiia bacterium]|nr:hypothetical protein [Acidimicrobiia bacterium]
MGGGSSGCGGRRCLGGGGGGCGRGLGGGCGNGFAIGMPLGVVGVLKGDSQGRVDRDVQFHQERFQGSPMVMEVGQREPEISLQGHHHVDHLAVIGPQDERFHGF